MNQSGSWRRVVTHLKPTRRQGVALVAAVGATAGLPLAAPQITRRIIDGAVADEPVGFLVMLAGAYLGIAVSAQLAKVVTAWLASRLAWDATNELREHLTEHALSLDLTDHSSRTPGEMIERVDGDVAAIADFVVAFLLEVVASLLLVLGVLALVLIADIRIGAVLLLYTVVAAFVIVPLQRAAVSAITAYRAVTGILFGHLEERFAAIEDIRANKAGDHAVDRFQEISRDRRDADIRGERLSGKVLATTASACGGATATVLALAVVFLGTGGVTLGTAVLLLQYTQMLQQPITRVVHHLQQYQKALAGLARVSAFMTLRPTLLPPPDGGSPLPAGAGGRSVPLAVELDDVSFVYPVAGGPAGQTALQGVSLRLEPGRALGLVGHTGSGKTTLARLLLRLHDPTAGIVRLGGLDLRDVSPASLTRRVAFVTQDVQMFTASVRDNLTLFRRHVPDDRLLDVLHDVDLGGWLASLPDGLDTVVGATDTGGARQAGLSAGEAQLLALCRAFLSDPGLVVMDEASSLLDPATETAIEQAVARLLEGRTAVVIAHRLSSLSRVDDIAVLDHGHLVEHGSRQVLADDPASRFGRLLRLAGAAS